MPDFKALAKDYIEAGFTVVPITDKRITLNEWTSFHGEDVFTPEWDLAWKKANGIGLSLGDKSQDIICLDVDILVDAPKEKLEIRENILKMMPPIYCGIKGNPKKPTAVFFKKPTSYEFRSTNQEVISIDLLGTGKQKALPPSYNPDSNTYYEWVGTPLLEADLDVMPELPVDIYNYVLEKAAEFKNNPHEIKLTPEKGRCNHGSHSYFGRFGKRLFYLGFSLDEMIDLAIDEDRKINANSDKLYFQCSTRPWKSNDIRLNATEWAVEFFQRNLFRRHQESEFFTDEIEAGFTIRDPDPEKKGYVRDYVRLAQYFKGIHQPYYIPGIRTFMCWDGKKYSAKDEAYVKSFAQKKFRNPICTKIHEKSTFVDYVKHDRLGDVADFSLDGSMLINLENGVYDFNERKLYPHDKKYKLAHLLPVSYVEKVEAPVWDRLMDLITCGRPHLQIAIEEYIGYIISGCSYDRFNKILILDGAGSNGKSTLISIIRLLVGPENCCSESLMAITQERFAAFSLYNKFVNFCSEEPKDAFSRTGPIKKLTGNDSMAIEQKGKDKFDYVNKAKLIISYNEMPFLPDDSDGMQRRLMIIPCEQNFEKHPELKLADPIGRIIKSEKEAVLFRCIKAFENVMDSGRFSDVPEGDVKLKEILLDSNPVAKFFSEEIEVTKQENDCLTTQYLYEKFLIWSGGYSKHSKDGFSKKASKLLKKYAIEGAKLEAGRGYRGVRHVGNR